MPYLLLRFLLLLLIIVNAGVRLSLSDGDALITQQSGATNANLPAPFLVDHAALSSALTSAAPTAGSLPPPVDPGALLIWAEPATVWMEVALRLIVVDSTAPPRAARDLMLLSVALHDGMTAADAARAAGQPISTDALFAEIAMRILAVLHPLHADAIRSTAEPAAWVGVWRGDATPEAVISSRVLGAAVADAVLAWAAADGADAPVGEPLRLESAPGRWAPTPPFFEAAQFPHWGEVRTVVIGDPAQLRATPPPAWNDPTMEHERTRFETTQAQLRAMDRQLAAAWAAGPGTVTPPGMWMQRAITLVRRDALITPDATRVYALLGIALHDVAVTCWESKYHYQIARPIQWLGERNPDWQPFLNTPPHPSYPSGHASFSGAASTVLSAFFPNNAHQLTLEAEAATKSRIVAGIHWSMDGVAGLAQGRAVAEQVLDHAGIDPAPPLP